MLAHFLITRKDCISFVNHPDTIVLISEKGDTTTTPPVNTELADNFKVACSQASYFKKSIKIDASFLLLLRN